MSTYIAPETLDDVLLAVAAGARPIAGGTDLVVGARNGKAPLPEALCAIHRVRDLAGIRSNGQGGLVLGALASHADITAHPLIRERFTGLADASAIVGSHATRNVGTIGGNVMNGSPAMDTGAPLICAGAIATLTSARGIRDVPVADLFVGPGKTRAEPDELLTSVLLPAPPAGTGSCYVRLEYRRHMEIAIVGVACQVSLDASGSVTDARIAITALAPTIHRVPEAEVLVVGDNGGSEAVRAAGDAVAAASRADLGRSGLRALPQGDGRGDRPPRDRRGTRARRRPPRPDSREPGAARRRGGLDMLYQAVLAVNGVEYPISVEAQRSLLSVLRNEIGLTGSKEGCDDSECGACMVLIDGRPVNSCSFLALQANGREITTVEGLSNGGELHPLQRAFLNAGGVQCGFCTPGMLISATALLRENPSPSEDEVRLALSGNLCRCTGYQKIVSAVLSAADELAATS